jgi:hypothetical protein
MRLPVLPVILASCFASVVAMPCDEARAVATIFAKQDGANVVFKGSGSLNLTELYFLQTVPRWFNYFSTRSSDAEFQVGAVPSSVVDLYVCAFGPCIVGPSRFGEISERYHFPDLGSGDAFGFWDFDGYRGIVVPFDYLSGSELTGTTTYLNRTLADMGIKPGTSVYSWGAGDTAGSILFTSEVPAPLPLWGAASALGWSRRLRRRFSQG